MNIRKVKNNWAYDFMLEGKRYRKAGFKTKSEAKLAGNQAYNEAYKGNVIDKNKTFNEYFKEWYDANGRDKLSDNQIKWYERAYKFTNEKLGKGVLLKDINRQTYQKLLNDYGEGRSDGSVKKLKGVMSQILRDATYDGYINKDPSYNIKINGTEPTKKEEDKYIKIQEYLDLIEYFKSRDEKSYILLYILAITGGRFSEVNNLKIEDLKFNEIHLPGTKTITSDRIVEVSVEDINLIKQKIDAHPRRIDGYIFNISNNAVKKSLNHAARTVGIPTNNNVTTYTLRHTHCSYLISKDLTIEYISKRLGHATITTTYNTYAHLLDEHKKVQGDKVRDIFSWS